MPSMTTIRGGLGLQNFGHCRGSIYWLLACVVVAALGCDDTPTLPPKPATPPAVNLPAGPSLNSSTPQPAPSQPTPAPAVAQAPPGDSVDGDPTPGGAADREKAVRGSGAQGRNYGGGVITEPVRQYFLLKQATVFEMQIPHAMNLFKAEHNRFPKDWAEFKREIIDPASVQLPDLREGERYVYDGQTGELMVEKPAPPAPPAAK
jgi:hypothetical protein